MHENSNGLEVSTGGEIYEDAGAIDPQSFPTFGSSIWSGRLRVLVRVEVVEGCCGLYVSEGLQGNARWGERILGSLSPEATLDLGWLERGDRIVLRNQSSGGKSRAVLSNIMFVPEGTFSAVAAAVLSKEEAFQALAVGDLDRLASLPDEVVTPTIHNFRPSLSYEIPLKLFVSSTQALKNAYLHYKRAPLALIPALQTAAKIDNPVYWDVGANLGVSTVQIAKKLGEVDGFTLAFECEPENLAALSQNLRINGLSRNAAAIQLAAGDKNGTLWLNVNQPPFLVDSEHNSESIRPKPVGGLGLHTVKDVSKPEVGVWGNYSSPGLWVLEIRLEQLVTGFGFRPPDYVFVDAALYENEIIDGMESLLVSPERPFGILVEQTPGGAAGNPTLQVEETLLFSNLSASGYEAFEVESYSIEQFHHEHVGGYMLTLFVDRSRLTDEVRSAIETAISSLSEKPSLL